MFLSTGLARMLHKGGPAVSTFTAFDGTKVPLQAIRAQGHIVLSGFRRRWVVQLARSNHLLCPSHHEYRTLHATGGLISASVSVAISPFDQGRLMTTCGYVPNFHAGICFDAGFFVAVFRSIDDFRAKESPAGAGLSSGDCRFRDQAASLRST